MDKKRVCYGILGLRRPELAHSHSHAPSTGTPAGGNRSPLRRSTANATPVETGRSLTDGDINNVVDVLPSFEMYNTLHRHIPQGNVDPDRHDFPPSYQEANNSTATGAAGSSADLSHQSLSTDALGATRSSSTSNLENLIPFEPNITVLQHINQPLSMKIHWIYLPYLMTWTIQTTFSSTNCTLYQKCPHPSKSPSRRRSMHLYHTWSRRRSPFWKSIRRGFDSWFYHYWKQISSKPKVWNVLCHFRVLHFHYW